MDFAWGWPGLPDPAGPTLPPLAPCFQVVPLPRGLPGCAYSQRVAVGVLWAVGRWEGLQPASVPRVQNVDG